MGAPSSTRVESQQPMQISPDNAGTSLTSRSEPRVLIVDDEAVIRTALSRYFVRLGWAVCTAPNGSGAVGVLGDGRVDFDLVICDLRMAGGSGEDVYRWLLERRPSLAARVVFLSGDTVAPEAAVFLEAARRPVLAKPFDLRELAFVAEQVCAERLSFRAEPGSGAVEESRSSR